MLASDWQGTPRLGNLLSKNVEIDQSQVDSSNQNKEFVTEELDNVDHNDFTEEDHESTLESDEIKVKSREHHGIFNCFCNINPQALQKWWYYFCLK